MDDPILLGCLKAILMLPRILLDRLDVKQVVRTVALSVLTVKKADFEIVVCRTKLHVPSRLQKHENQGHQSSQTRWLGLCALGVVLSGAIQGHQRRE